VVKVGSRQYRAEEDRILEVERLSFKPWAPAGDQEHQEVRLKEVLLVGQDGKTEMGQPFVAGASVLCEVLGEQVQPKTISFKIKRRKGYRRKKGHRQTLTRLRVKRILVE